MICEEIMKADAAMKQWEARKDHFRAQLIALNDAGLAPRSFQYGGKTWSRTDGKKTWSYPPDVRQMEATLKSAKTICQHNGTATFVMGDPYYGARETKAAKEAAGQ